jgi:glutaredoxin 3
MEFLSQKGVAFVAKDVSSDAEARAELIAVGSRSTPTIKVGSEVLIGFNPAKLLALLGRSG